MPKFLQILRRALFLLERPINFGQVRLLKYIKVNNLKNKRNFSGKANFFAKTNGKIRGIQVTIQQPANNNKKLLLIVRHHPYKTTN